MPVDVLCFTHGEASTLGRHDGQDLGERRAAELAVAGDVLGVERTELLACRDGRLADRQRRAIACHASQATDNPVL